jgi:hypothetical protein
LETWLKIERGLDNALIDRNIENNTAERNRNSEGREVKNKNINIPIQLDLWGNEAVFRGKGQTTINAREINRICNDAEACVAR